MTDYLPARVPEIVLEELRRADVEDAVLADDELLHAVCRAANRCAFEGCNELIAIIASVTGVILPNPIELHDDTAGPAAPPTTDDAADC